ncbi:MAG: bifunctional phosphoribosylaminoimidazolecarboxamide formyltransferase/IMP cyclohydrolase [Cyanobacteria bacterium]|nr:bifunctional phosphoribosylaminoimidazolecarboxamide formyltransferase/IMP cyclohydrolase [Cyanobacteriota bacterium]
MTDFHDISDVGLDPTRPIALVSVYDKSKLETLAEALIQSYEYQVLATGGTAEYLRSHNIPVTDLSTITGFDELLGGRVKTLHPAVFASILAHTIEDRDSLPFTVDTVVVNLYPYESTQKIDAIDIGGSALLRAAAKNADHVTVLCSPEQYTPFLQELKLGNGETSDSFRHHLARQAFARSLAYEQCIASTIYGQSSPAQTDPSQTKTSQATETLTLSLHKVQDLRYGENPHQHAALYSVDPAGIPPYDQIQGKDLSYNNLLDMEAGWNIVQEFTTEAACAIIKHNNPCGVAISKRGISDAYHTAFFCDSLSAFGGVVALNQPLDLKTATELKDVFLEVIIAPGFEPDALALLSSKKNLRLVKKTPHTATAPLPLQELRPLEKGWYLAQDSLTPEDSDLDALTERGLTCVTQKKPTLDQIEDLRFAWKIVKHAKSNAIVLAKDGRTVGIGVGQTSRIGALESALRTACDEAKDAVMASDGFLPHEDNIHAAVQARISAIIQPGGSIKDEAVLKLANQYGLSMIQTGVRVFKH